MSTCRLTLAPAALWGLALLLPFSAPADDARPLPQSPADRTALSLEQLLNLHVQAAALHPQTLEEAPASVTVLTALKILISIYRP